MNKINTGSKNPSTRIPILKELVLYTLGAFLAGHSLIIKAQKVDVISGSKEVIRGIEMIPSVFGHDSSGYYALIKPSVFGIAKYDNNLVKTKESLLDLSGGLKKREIVDLVHFQDSVCLLYSTERINYSTLWLQTISKDTLGQIDPARSLMHIRFVRGWKPEFGVTLSRDESKLLVHATQIIHGQKTGLIYMKVLEDSLKIRWEKRFWFTFERVLNHKPQFAVDSLGNAYMLDRFYTPLILNMSGRTNEYIMLAVSKDGSQSHKIRFGLTGFFIKNIVMAPADPRHVICAGFCSNTMLQGTVTGGFFFKMNLDLGRVVSRQLFSIEEEQISTEEPFGLHADHLITQKGGSSFLVAEQVIPQDYNGYQNLLVCRFNQSGNLLWQRVLRKEQVLSDRSVAQTNLPNRNKMSSKEFWPDGTPIDHSRSGSGDKDLSLYEHTGRSSQIPQKNNYSSYALMAPLEKDLIGIAFNDDLRNCNNNGNRLYTFSAGRKSCLRFVTINSNGVISMFRTYDRDRRRKALPMPVLYYDNNKGMILMPSVFRNNKLKFIGISIN